MTPAETQAREAMKRLDVAETPETLAASSRLIADLAAVRVTLPPKRKAAGDVECGVSVLRGDEWCCSGCGGVLENPTKCYECREAKEGL